MQVLKGWLGAVPVEIRERPRSRAYVADERGDVGEVHRHAILANFVDHPPCGLKLTHSDIGGPGALVVSQAEQPAYRDALVATDLFSEESSARLDDSSNVGV